MRLVIAHEDIVIRKDIRQTLEKMNFSVVAEASNGLQAYNKYIEYYPDVILLSLSLTIHDGLNTLNRIKGYAPEAICVMIGEPLKNREFFQALENGAAHYMTIPVNEEQVHKILIDIKYMMKEVNS